MIIRELILIKADPRKVFEIKIDTLDYIVGG